MIVDVMADPAALTGRFLHITDIHPDKHYVSGSTIDSGCHNKPESKGKGGKRKGKDKEDLAGPWGVGVRWVERSWLSELTVATAIHPCHSSI